MDWDTISDSIFLLVLTSPIWVTISTAIYVVLAAVFGLPL